MVVLASFFDRLFKFSSLQFSEGRFGLQADDLLMPFILLVLALGTGIALIYYAARIYRSNRSRFISLGLRITALLILCIPLFEPVLIVPDVVPRENFVAVLVDASQSMQIRDGSYGPDRIADARYILNDENDGILQSLREDFNLRYYTFSDQAVRTDSINSPQADGPATNLSAALDQVQKDFTGIPLAGIVLLTDGRDNRSESPQSLGAQLAGRSIPLHVIGLGGETLASDREILEATVSEQVGQSTGAEIDLKVRSWQTQPDSATVSLYRNDELMLTENRELSGNGTVDQFSFFYEPDENGTHEYRLELSPAPEEINTENNFEQLLINTRSDTSRVLYVEGHPRYEFKYVKRTLQNDPAVKFVSIMRTGPGRFYRQGIEHPDELTGGFADSTAELNRYKAIILGDIEAGAFTPDQLGIIEQFVRIRGGGLVMLGGGSSFGAGNYHNTPIADLLPVRLPPRSTSRLLSTDETTAPDSLKGFQFQPTRDGLEHSILRLSSDPSINRTRWQNLPPLQTLNPLGELKPGAVSLAEATPTDGNDLHPALIVQRYGKGRSMALPTTSTWRWQMERPAEDTRYQRFWRQLIRWLTASAPDPVELNFPDKKFTPGETVPLQVQIYDDAFFPREDAIVEGTVIDPGGNEHIVELQQNVLEPGMYETAFVPEDSGVYELNLTGRSNGRTLGTARRPFLVRPSNREFDNAGLNRELLEEIADASDGYYYAPSEIDQIPANLATRNTERSIYRGDYLWDMPFLFGLAVLLLSIEWVYRRRRGLP
jgi:uncharacterized membrane protein